MGEGQDLLRQIASAGARLDPRLSDRDVERVVEGAHRRLRRRAIRRVALLAVPAVALIVAIPWLAGGSRSGAPIARAPESRSPATPTPPAPPAPRARASDRVVRLSDGSVATALDPSSDLDVAKDSAARVELVLNRGRGRFEVAPRPERAFLVRAGDVTVSVIGTLFTVERVADRVGVTVERGTVHVDWGLGARLLQAGESGWFPPLQVSASGQPPSVGSSPATPSVARARIALRDPKGKANNASSHESAESMLLAADRARLAGHPEQGVALLRLLLKEHREDPRAPLAAFTLGRVLLMELGQPADAAAAFAEVRRLSPGGPFAEDALAREVEAWRQAAQPERAHARALEYLSLYPAGRRATSVRSMGKVD
jgi:transmembrane sensor